MNTLIVMLSGKQGSGKTTTAQALRDKWISEGIPVINYKFAQPLYEMHDVIYMVAKDYGIEIPPAGKDKTLLQLLGTEWGRNTRGKNVWVRCAQRKIDKMTEQVRAAGQFHIVIIDDLRFKNELDMADAVRIRIECPRDVRFKRCSTWRDNENHASEIDLDDSLSKFDLVVDTSLAETAAVVESIDKVCRERFPDRYKETDRDTVDSRTVKMSDVVSQCR